MKVRIENNLYEYLKKGIVLNSEVERSSGNLCVS